MTVSSANAKAVHQTSLEVSDYTFPFKVFQSSEVAVSLVDRISRREAALNLGSDYEVLNVGQESGGTVRLSEAGQRKAGNGQHLIILRSMRFLQEIDYRPHDIFPAETHERALDILTMQDQELREMLGRAFIAPPDQNNPIEYGELEALRSETLSARDEAGAAARSAGSSEITAAAAVKKTGEDALLAEKWADNPEDEPVLPGQYSARHWALKANETASSGMPDAGTETKGKVMLAAINDSVSADKAETPAGAQAKADAAETAAKAYTNDQIKSLPKAGGFNTREVIEISRTYAVPLSGWYKITCIGGGGGGGGGAGGGAYTQTQTRGYSGLGGKQGGSTTINLPVGAIYSAANRQAQVLGTALPVSAAGGSGGGGASASTAAIYGCGGGGGGSGLMEEFFAYLHAGSSLLCTIGGGGAGGSQASDVYGGKSGEGPFGGQGAQQIYFTTIPGLAGGGLMYGESGSNYCAGSYPIGGSGGYGASSPTGFGGGGGGGSGGYSSIHVVGRLGKGGANASDGQMGSVMVNNVTQGGNGGAGGPGAIIMEYFDQDKA